MRLGFILCSIVFLGVLSVRSQVAPDCINAIPICNNTPVNGGTNGYGNDDYKGAKKSGCLEQTTSGVIESNSAWYRFRTGASGQLGFNIGIDPSEDWDFALYKTSDCTNLGDPIRCNFFDNSDGNSYTGVGEDPSGNTETYQYEDWLEVAPGEDYYLMINNFSNNNSGFSIQFSGHIFETNPNDALDCSIISNLLGPPIAACEYENVVLDATTTDATAYNWFRDIGNGFEPIPGENKATYQVVTSALYRVEVIVPSGNNIVSDVQVAFSTAPTTYPVSDDAYCSSGGIYDLSQKDAEALGVQSPQEFRVSYHSTYADAVNGTNNLPKAYAKDSGAETIYVRTTSVTNPNCFDASQQFQLTAVATPIVAIPEEAYLCENNASVSIGDSNPNPKYTYFWDSGETSSQIVVNQAGTYGVTVTNELSGQKCSINKQITVVASESPKIGKILIEDLQSNNTVTIITEKEGTYEYALDNGSFQSDNTFNNVVPGKHTVTLNDVKGCGMVTESIVVVGFPKYFSPNGDGVNDKWQIVGISSLEDPIVFIYDRYGKLLKQMDKNNLGWDGTFNGTLLPSSDYWFKLSYLTENGQRSFAKYVNNHFSLSR